MGTVPPPDLLGLCRKLASGHFAAHKPLKLLKPRLEKRTRSDLRLKHKIQDLTRSSHINPAPERSIRLQSCGLHDLAPLFGIRRDQTAEIRGRPWQR
jgi:hypothetical protein